MRDSHLKSLQRKHHDLETRIHEEASHPAHDALLIRRLKNEKLLLKEEMERLRSVH